MPSEISSTDSDPSLKTQAGTGSAMVTHTGERSTPKTLSPAKCKCVSECASAYQRILGAGIDVDDRVVRRRRQPWSAAVRDTSAHLAGSIRRGAAKIFNARQGHRNSETLDRVTVGGSAVCQPRSWSVLVLALVIIVAIVTLVVVV